MSLLRFIALLGLTASPGWALVTIGDDPASLAAPANGAPWKYVAQLGTAGGFGGSAVYLGNGFLLTANHVTPFGPVFLNGVLYRIDPSFGSGGAREVGALDLKVIRIMGDPNLPPLELTNAMDLDLGQASTMIGWGVGKGTPIDDQGWFWGGATTAAERWGSNVTDAALYETQPSDGDFAGEHLTTHFDLAAGGSEAQLAVLDSGSALFQNFGGVWKLAGIGVGADQADTVQAALYDHDSQTSGYQPDASYYLRVKTVREEILAAAGVPEPSLGALLLLGGAILGHRQTRFRRVPCRLGTLIQRGFSADFVVSPSPRAGVIRARRTNCSLTK